MNISDITSITSLLVKWFVVVGLALYAAFALILVRQEHLMAKELEERFEPVLRLLVFIHFVAALIVLVLGILLL